MKLFTILAVSAASYTSISIAQTERDLGSHEHGSAILNIALDGSDLIIELETPWNNMVGFEHAPKTDEQHTLVDDALALLNTPDQLFGFVGTQCQVTEAVLESTLAEESDEHHDEHEDEHHDDDKDEHDDEKHNDDEPAAKESDDDHHDEHEDEHGDEEETHSVMLATYSFGCKNMSDLSAIDIHLFTFWSGFDDLDAQLIGPGGQTTVELNAQQVQVDINLIQ